jgi:membrane protease YdiL (CAAX protease family)
MDWLKKFASSGPIAFSVVATLLLWLCYISIALVSSAEAMTPAGQQSMDALGRLVAALGFAAVLWRLGWLRAAGVTRPGARRAWLLVVPVLILEVLAHMYGFFGSLDLSMSYSGLAGAVALNGAAAGLLEELVFRAIVLYALLRLWGGTTHGMLKSVLVSASFFGAAHLIHLFLGKQAALVLLLVLSAYLGGIYYGAFVLYSRSVWPAVVLHVALNALVGTRAVTSPGFSETVSGWLLVLALQLPVVVLGVLLIHRVPPESVER